MKIFEIIILLIAGVAAVMVLLAVTGRKAVQGAAKTASELGSAAQAGIAATVTAAQNHATSEVGYTGSGGIAPGTYVTAGTLQNPLAFTVVGGIDNRPAIGQLFGNQAGYGGITASKEGAGAAGYRPGGTGSWSSTGYTTRY